MTLTKDAFIFILVQIAQFYTGTVQPRLAEVHLHTAATESELLRLPSNVPQ
jgi:hypothetical protein